MLDPQFVRPQCKQLSPLYEVLLSWRSVEERKRKKFGDETRGILDWNGYLPLQKRRSVDKMAGESEL